MRIFLVGGAVRDNLLKLPFEERDWVVVGATDAEMRERGFKPIDADFPVFAHPETGEEYALARREVKTGLGYKGFSVDAGPGVTLEEDLARRDLRINAMARAEDGSLIDPYDGQADLEQGLLRHVTPAFVEDPVRLLRIARFAAKLGDYGFHVAPATHALMQEMAESADLAALRSERVWRELKKSLAEPQPWRFFEVLMGCGAGDIFPPPLRTLFDTGAGHDAKSPSSGSRILQAASRLSPSPEVRYAALLAQALPIGDAGEVISHQLRAERPFQELLARVQGLRPALRALEATDAEGLLNLLQRARADQHPEQFEQAWLALTVLHPACTKSLNQPLRLARAVMGEISGAHIRSDGFVGREIGLELKRRRRRVLQDRLSSGTLAN